MWALMLNYGCGLPGPADYVCSLIAWYNKASIKNPVSNVTVDDHTGSGLLW